MKSTFFKKWCKNEAEATTFLLQFFRKQEENWIAYKIRDIWNVSKPCDVIWFDDKGHVIYAEIKYCSSKKEPTLDWAISKLEPHQYVTLSRVDACSHKKLEALIIVYHKLSWYFYFFSLQDGQNTTYKFTH